MRLSVQKTGVVSIAKWGAEQRPTAIRQLQEPWGNPGHAALAGQAWWGVGVRVED